MPLLPDDLPCDETPEFQASAARYVALPPRYMSQLTLSSRQNIKLLQLPQELLLTIISHVKCRDVFTLRTINRQLHNLIHENESTIVRRHLLEGEAHPPTYFMLAGSLSLDLLTDLRYRVRTCRQLASILATQCCANLRPQSQLDDREAWRMRKTEKLKTLLKSSFLALYEYFIRLREIVLRTLHEFEEYLIADFNRLGSILDLDQQRILETFPTDSLMHIAQAWRILERVSRAKNVPPEVSSAKFPYTTVKVALILGGLDRFTSLISKGSKKERIQDLDTFGAELWHGEPWRPYVSPSGPPLGSIHHLATPQKRVSFMDFPKNMGQGPVLTFISRQNICESSLKAVILRLQGTLDNILPVDSYICDAVREEGDSFRLLSSWNALDDPR